jgi:hypothetical protein
VERVGVRIGVIALEDRLARLVGILAKARHAALRLVIAKGFPIGMEEESKQMRKRVIHRRGVRLATDEVVGLARGEVKCTQDVQGACARSGVTANFRIARLLVLAIIGLPNHGAHLGESSLGDGLEKSGALVGVSVGIHKESGPGWPKL